jgi:hypothetical protein
MAKLSLGSRALAEKRTLNRVPVAPGSGFFVTLQGESFKHSLELLDISPLGVSVKLPEQIISDGIFEGDVLLTIKFGKRIIGEVKNPKVIRFLKEEKVLVLSMNSSSRHSNRDKNRLATRAAITPTVMGPNPIRPNDLIHFRVENFNSTGMLLSTSLRNKYLLPGTTIEKNQLIIPGLRIFEVAFQIRHSAVLGDRLFVGVQFLRSSKEMLEAFAQYSMYGAVDTRSKPPAMIKSLEASGLSAKKIAKGFDISILDNPSDYAEILNVRLEAYREAGKTSTEMAEDMADEFDSRSILLCARAGGKVVGTVRLVRSDGSQKFPFESLVEFPKNMSSRKEFYEVSRLAIIPEFQGTDLVIALFKAVAREVTISKTAALCLATMALRPLYIRMGASKISGEVPHPTVDSETLALFLLDTERFLGGKGMAALAWDFVVKDVFEDLMHFGFRKGTGFNPGRAFMRNIEKFVLMTRNSKKKSKRKSKD